MIEQLRRASHTYHSDCGSWAFCHQGKLPCEPSPGPAWNSNLVLLEERGRLTRTLRVMSEFKLERLDYFRAMRITGVDFLLWKADFKVLRRPLIARCLRTSEGFAKSTSSFFDQVSNYDTPDLTQVCPGRSLWPVIWLLYTSVQ